MGKPVNAIKALRRFRKIFHDHIELTDHHMSSPLGAWMLLAFLSDGADNGKIEELLGMNGKNARKTLAAMVNADAAGVTALVKGWISPIGLEHFAAMMERNTFADTIEKRIPEKAELDEWLAKNTHNILTEFPFTPDSNTDAIFASIIATDISWSVPFKSHPANEDWAAWKLEKVLYDGDNYHTHLYEVDGKLYLVHSAYSKEAVTVKSVLPLQDATQAELLKAADDIATGFGKIVDHRFSDGNNKVLTSGNFDVMFEHVGMKTTTGDEDFFFDVELPAWETTDKFDLKDPALGFAIAAELTGNQSFEACQVVKASFQLTGFKAAALTTMMVGRSAAFVPTERVPVYRAKFNKPFSVFVVSDNKAFRHLPLFTGVISKGIEPDTD